MARMRDAFVVRDQNGINEMIPSQKERPMAMGDGTFMSDNAFKESIPMMSYTPEELGINMAAYPMATDTAMHEHDPRRRSHTSTRNKPVPQCRQRRRV